MRGLALMARGSPALEVFLRRPLLSILAIALLVRLPLIGSRPLWYDEAFAVLFSSKGLASMLYGTLKVEGAVAADVHPLLYYTLLGGWARIVGTGPAAVRALSVILGLGVVALGFALARTLLDARAAFFSGLLLAISPFQVHYSQEVRMYGLLALLLLGATWVYWLAMARGSAGYWVAFAVLAAAAQYTHNLAAVYLLPLAFTPVLRGRWRDMIKTAAAGGGALTLYSPWLLRLPSQLARIQQAYWIPRPGPTEWVRTLITYVVGLPVPAWSLSIALALSVLVAVMASWLTLRAWRQAEPGFRTAVWLAYLAIIPAILMFAVSMWRPVYLDRALLASAADGLLWLGWLLSRVRLPSPAIRVSAVALILAFPLGLYGFYSYAGFPYAPYASLDAYLSSHRSPGEVIVHSNKISALPAHYYAPDLTQRYLADPPRSGSDTLAPATQEVLAFVADPDVAAATGDASGVWFVIFPREIEDYRSQGYTDQPALAWLESGYRLESQTMFGDLRVYHFVRGDTPG